MDRISADKRSWNMSRINSRNTKPEKAVRSLLHRMGYRFRLHKKDLPGKPDIVLPKHRTVVFVHGCFWHRHENCRYTTTPKSNRDFWLAKFKTNVERDKAKASLLEAAGWKVIVVWQCELSDLHTLKQKLESLITDNC